MHLMRNFCNTVLEKKVKLVHTKPKVFNPLTGEYFWAQQLTVFKRSQLVYT